MPAVGRHTGRAAPRRAASDARLITCTAVSRRRRIMAESTSVYGVQATLTARSNHGRVASLLSRTRGGIIPPVNAAVDRHPPQPGRSHGTPSRTAVVVPRICSRRRCYCPAGPLGRCAVFCMIARSNGRSGVKEERPLGTSKWRIPSGAVVALL